MTNLVNILKYCPEGTKLYSPIFGEVTFKKKYQVAMTYFVESQRIMGTLQQQPLLVLEDSIVSFQIQNVCFFHQKTKEIGMNLKYLSKEVIL